MKNEVALLADLAARPGVRKVGPPENGLTKQKLDSIGGIKYRVVNIFRVIDDEGISENVRFYVIQSTGEAFYRQGELNRIDPPMSFEDEIQLAYWPVDVVAVRVDNAHQKRADVTLFKDVGNKVMVTKAIVLKSDEGIIFKEIS